MLKWWKQEERQNSSIPCIRHNLDFSSRTMEIIEQQLRGGWSFTHYPPLNEAKKIQKIKKWWDINKKNHEKVRSLGFKYRREIPRLPQDDHHCLSFHISQCTQGETLRPETCEDMDFYHLPSEMQDISAYFQNIAAKQKPIGGEKSGWQQFLKVCNRTSQNKNLKVVPWDPFLHHLLLQISYSGVLPGTQIHFSHKELSVVVVKNNIIAW